METAPTLSEVPPPPPPALAANASRKQDENSAKILSSIKLVLESRQSHYANGTASNGSRPALAAAAHVDRITHFIIPPEGPGQTQRVNVATIERVTTEATPPTTSERAVVKEAVKQKQSAPTAASRTPPHRGVPKGVPKGNKTSTQTRLHAQQAQQARPAAGAAGLKRAQQKQPAQQQAQRVPRPQQTSSRLKETVVRTNVHVGQGGQGGRRAGAVAQVVRPPATAAPRPDHVAMERVVTLPAKKDDVEPVRVEGVAAKATANPTSAPGPSPATDLATKSTAAPSPSTTRQARMARVQEVEGAYPKPALSEVDLTLPYADVHDGLADGLESVNRSRRTTRTALDEAPRTSSPASQDPGSVSA